MLAEVQKRLPWYTEHLTTLGSAKFDIKKMLSILENTNLVVGQEFYYPIPGGCCIIANTYERPVISYSDIPQYSATTLPYFTSPRKEKDAEPIILGMINSCHCISISLDIRPELPIPHIRSEWFTLRDTIAIGWEERFLGNITVYKEWRKSENKMFDWSQARQIDLQSSSSDLSEPED